MDDLISRDFIKSLGGECIAARDSKTHELLPISSIDALPSAQPELHYDEWCETCKEYDQERHSCPRWNRVIRQTVDDLKIAQPTQKNDSNTLDALDCVGRQAEN